MEQINIKEKYLLFILLSIFFGTTFTLCLYKNFSGIATILFTIVWMCCLLLGLKKLEIKVTKISYLYGTIIILFGVSNIITTNGLIIFLNWVAMFTLGLMMLIHSFYDVKDWQFIKYFIAIFSVIGQAVLQIFSPISHFIYYREQRQIKESKLKYVIIGLLISIPLVIIILILLSSADSIFSSMFTNIFVKFDFSNIFGVMVFFFVGTIGFYALFVSLCNRKIKNDSIDIRQGEPVIAITIISILTVIYLVFCFIQVLYLFIGGKDALPDGFTYSSYARKGFFQLLFVSIINFSIVLMSVRVFKEHKALKILLAILSTCTYILIASSAYRMTLYVSEYNLTFLRILVLWFLMLEVVLMTGVFISIFNNRFNLFRFCFISVTVFYLAFSFAKPDRIIAEYNYKDSETLTYSDALYMVDNLSADAAPIISKIDLSKIDFGKDEYYANTNKEFLKSSINNYFGLIKDSYKKRGIRGFNFANYDAYNVADKRLTF